MGNPRCTAAGLDTLGEDGPAIWSSAEEDGPAIWSSAADVGCRRAGRWTGRGPGVAGTAAEAAH